MTDAGDGIMQLVTEDGEIVPVGVQEEKAPAKKAVKKPAAKKPAAKKPAKTPAKKPAAKPVKKPAAAKPKKEGKPVG